MENMKKPDTKMSIQFIYLYVLFHVKGRMFVISWHVVNV